MNVSTRIVEFQYGFGITFAEAMAADCTVIAANHPESVASEVSDDAGYLVEPTADAIANALDRALAGERPSGNPVRPAERYNWDSVAQQAATVYERALTTEWDAFALQAGSGTKEGANKRLVASADSIPKALWEVYDVDTGETASEENAFAESSDHTTEVR